MLHTDAPSPNTDPDTHTHTHTHTQRNIKSVFLSKKCLTTVNVKKSQFLCGHLTTYALNTTVQHQVPLLSRTWFSCDFIFSFFKLHYVIIIIIIIIIIIQTLLPKSIKCFHFYSCFTCSSVCNYNLPYIYYMSPTI